MTVRTRRNRMSFDALVGYTFRKVWINDRTCITFEIDDNHWFEMYHEQDCCESVELIDQEGDFSDLVGNPITIAEENWQKGCTEGTCTDKYCESCTWTFYKIATMKGQVDMRWHGTSNGYYSESVDLFFVRKVVE